MDSIETAIANEMVKKVIAYIKIAQGFSISVADIVGTRRNLVERWKKKSIKS